MHPANNHIILQEIGAPQAVGNWLCSGRAEVLLRSFKRPRDDCFMPPWKLANREGGWCHPTVSKHRAINRRLILHPTKMWCHARRDEGLTQTSVLPTIQGGQCRIILLPPAAASSCRQCFCLIKLSRFPTSVASFVYCPRSPCPVDVPAYGLGTYL